ncbi:MAG: branched-chain amino acid transaminase [Chloroflexi bacterium]|uniref:Branched-chain-amino-acid aminotransferase n=1 Tax=Candidatus Chlorohelix allophototropha TaxID=3003348 RepID=A0A8T7M931_9CHLR|nr:branched-chain amino acid transaminase [Chloroflexota bacterium]WJW68468.1 branched-chain amino acid transaminase [Chloroflexota bacterium L227-S17]
MSNVMCYFEGKYVPLAEAKISIMTHAFNYGTACFEGIRGYWNEEKQELYLFRLREHYERLANSVRILGFKLPGTVDELCEITTELVRRAGFKENIYIRPTAYIASEVIGVRLHDLKYEFCITCQPFGAYVSTDGLKVGVSSWKRIDDNMIPARSKIAGAYVNSAFAKTEALLNGFDEAIMLTSDGHVSEGSAENFFMYVGGKLVTPPVSENILVGITRNTIITLAREGLGIETVDRVIDRTELYIADEILLCGTGAQVAPVISVDRRPVGDGAIGPFAQRLQKLYDDVVRGKNPVYLSWCTPVYQTSDAIAQV